jgi:hypothetical protein
MRDDDAFRVLGVPSSATTEEIRAAFRRLVKAWHPDRHASSPERRAIAEETMKRVIDAYRAVRNRRARPEPESRPQSAPPTGTSMFSVTPTQEPSFRASRQPSQPSAEEVRLRRRQVVREWLPRVTTMAAILVASIWASGWWLPKMWNLGIAAGVISVVPLPKLPESLEKAVTLSDRVACYSETPGVYEFCIRLRLIDRQYGLNPFPRRKPSAFQLALCGRLQQPYSAMADNKCVAELQAPPRD